jgi:hypothetical protein
VDLRHFPLVDELDIWAHHVDAIHTLLSVLRRDPSKETVSHEEGL